MATIPKNWPNEKTEVLLIHQGCLGGTPVSQGAAGKPWCLLEGSACLAQPWEPAEGTLVDPASEAADLPGPSGWRCHPWFLRMSALLVHRGHWNLLQSSALALEPGGRDSQKTRAPAHPRVLSSNLVVFDFCCRKRARHPSTPCLLETSLCQALHGRNPPPIPLGFTQDRGGRALA